MGHEDPLHLEIWEHENSTYFTMEFPLFVQLLDDHITKGHEEKSFLVRMKTKPCIKTCALCLRSFLIVNDLVGNVCLVFGLHTRTSGYL